MKKHLVLMVSLSVLLALGLVGFAEAAKKKKPVVEEEEMQDSGPVVVPEEAKRYLGQGKAIAERAKSPQDYEEAIRAFEKAASLAPTWPEIYDDLAYAQENAEKYPEAIKSLRKYLTLASSYVDKKSFEVRIYKLEEKMKYMAGPGGDVELAQKLVGTWIQGTDPRASWEIEATGAKVRGQFFMDHPEYPRPMGSFDAEVGKGRLMGTQYGPAGFAGWERGFNSWVLPLNGEFNLSPDGRSLTLDFGNSSPPIKYLKK